MRQKGYAEMKKAISKQSVLQQKDTVKDSVLQYAEHVVVCKQGSYRTHYVNRLSEHQRDFCVDGVQLEIKSKESLVLFETSTFVVQTFPKMYVSFGRRQQILIKVILNEQVRQANNSKLILFSRCKLFKLHWYNDRKLVNYTETL